MRNRTAGTWLLLAALLGFLGCTGANAPPGEQGASVAQSIGDEAASGKPAPQGASSARTQPQDQTASSSNLQPSPGPSQNEPQGEKPSGQEKPAASQSEPEPQNATTGSQVQGSPDRPLTRGGVPPAKEDVLLLSYPNDPDTINALTSNDTVSRAWQQWVYEALAESRFDDPDKWDPALAESWQFDQEKLEYTIKLRRGVKWHPIRFPNGKWVRDREVTAYDVKFTFDCILNPHTEAAALRSYYLDPDAKNEEDRIKIQVKVIDKYTVKIRWKKPYFMANEFTLGIPIIPRHVYSRNEQGEPISLDFRSQEFAQAFNSHWANNMMCGTGPLRLEKWERNKQVVLVRNEEYWGKPFYFSHVIYKQITNPSTVFHQVLNGELDWSGISDRNLFVQGLERPEVKQGKVVALSYEYMGYRYVGWNLTRPQFRDREVRWALSYATPVDSMIKNILHGLAVRVTGPFLPSSPANDPELKPVPYDLDKARQMLDKAGWRDTDGDGIRDKVIDGQKVPLQFELMIYADSPMYRRIAEMMKDSYRQIGVQMLISPNKWALMLQRLRKRNFDACMLGWALSWRGDPFQIWHSSQADLPDSSNAISYRNPQVDKLIDRLRVTMDPQEQYKLYRQIHRLIYEDQPYTFLFQDKATVMHHARLENIKLYPKQRPHVDMREWYSRQPRLLGQ